MAGVPWDGFRIMEWLHRLDARKIPIIIITGGEDIKNKERALASGAVAFFHKPINHDDLLKVVRATLGEHRQTGLKSGLPFRPIRISYSSVFWKRA